MRYLGSRLVVLAIMLSYIAIIGCDVMSFVSGRYEMPFHSLLAITHYPERPEVDVCSFGATGDGLTDDTAAIQTAIDALSEGDTLLFPVGVYVTSSPLTISNLNNILVRGYGAELRLPNPYNNNNFALKITDSTNIKVEGITFNRQNSYYTGERDHGIVVTDCVDIMVRDCDFSECSYGVALVPNVATIERVHVMNCRQIGRLDYSAENHSNLVLCSYMLFVQDESGVRDCSIIGCYQYQGWGLVLVPDLCTNFIIRDNWVKDSHDSSIYVSGTGMLISGNIVINAGKDGIKSTNVGYSHQCIIANNYIKGAGYHQSDGGVCIGMNGANQQAIGNVIELTNDDDIASPGEIGIFAASPNQQIIGNIIEGYTNIEGSGVLIRPLQENMHSTLVNGNVINNIRRGTSYDVHNTEHNIGSLTISDNSFHDCRTGIFVYNSYGRERIKNVLIKDNTFYTSVEYSIYQYNVESPMILGNVILNMNAQFGMCLIDATNVFVCGNYGDGSAANHLIRTINTVTYRHRADNYQLDDPQDPVVVHFADGDTSPSVQTYCPDNVFKTANTTPIVITMFDDGYQGQRIQVIIDDDNTSVAFSGAHLKGNEGTDWSPSSGDHMTCVFDGTDWYCTVSNNAP